MMLSITGDADCCRPTCQGEGCPSPARAASAPDRMATIVIANTVNRLSTNIVGIAPSNEQTVLLAQADRGCHAALSRSIALRVVIIFRMTATMMTLDFLSAAARRLWKVLRAGL